MTVESMMHQRQRRRRRRPPRPRRPTSYLVAFVSAIVLSCACNVQAAPATPRGFRHWQPDGSRTPLLYVHGDETLHYVTDAEGYTVIRDDDNGGWYVYARRAKDHDHLVSSGGRVGFVRPQKLGLDRHIRPPRRPSASVHDQPGEVSPTPPRRRNLRFSGERGNPVVLKALVVLIRFSDHKNRDLPSHQDIEILCNEPGGHPELAPTGSVRDVWFKNSFGRFDIAATVTQWIDLPETEAYYANNHWGWDDPITQEAFFFAMRHIDENTSIDLESFDEDQNRVFDAISFVHSGFASEHESTDCETGNGERQRIWSHRAAAKSVWTSSTGIRLASFFVASAIWPTSYDPLCTFEIGHVGVFVHESGHHIGLPDLYDPFGVGNGIGNFDFMGNMWGWDGTQRYPPPLTPWSKLSLNWVDIVILDRAKRYEIDASYSVDEIYVIDHNFPDPTTEYLIVENRHAGEFDINIPGGGGLAIYHIDRRVGHGAAGFPDQPGWPANGRHYQNALLSADGKYDLEQRRGHGDGTDLFRAGVPGVVANAIGPEGINIGKEFPNTDSYQGGNIVETGIFITDISEAGFVMSFELAADGLLGECEDDATFLNAKGKKFCKKLKKKKKKKRKKECKKAIVADRCPVSCNSNCK